MYLQPKRQISAEVATQKKLQIDEGIKIARKIDVVREALVKEEGKLKRFREETVRTVQKEIDGFIVRKNELRGEIKVLEREKKEVLKPVETEKKSVKLDRQKLDKEKMEWASRVADFSEQETHIARTKKQSENELGRASEFKHTAALNFAKSTEVLKDSEYKSKKTQEKASIVLASALAKEKEVNLRDSELGEREEELQKVADRQQAKDIEQANKDKEIKDRYQTLERTVKRMTL